MAGVVDAAERRSPAWRKALWIQQPYPDNHTSEKFLEALVVNDGSRRSYWRILLAALAVNQQICAAAIVCSVAHDLRQGALNPRRVLPAEAGALLAGLLLHAGARLHGDAPRAKWRPQLRPVQGVFSLGATLFLLGIAAAMSPVYATLTASVSPDTILTCTCALLVSHLYLHDYHQPAHSGGSLAGSLGLACALCASVLMASQLSTLEQVFALVLLSLEVYIFAPQLQRRLAGALPFSRALLPAAFAVAALLLVGRQSVLLTSALLCMLAFVALLCPMWLVRIHKFKAQINGPWDEAAPRLSSKLAAPSLL